MRGTPENDVVDLLVDQILTDGFITNGDPLLVTQPPELLAEAEAPWYLVLLVRKLVSV